MKLSRVPPVLWLLFFSFLLSSSSFAANDRLEAAIAQQYVKSAQFIENWFPKGKLPDDKLRASLAVMALTFHLDVSIVGVMSQEGLISENSPPEAWKLIENLWIRILHHLEPWTLLYVLSQAKDLDEFQFIRGTPAENLQGVVPSKRMAVRTAKGCASIVAQ